MKNFMLNWKLPKKIIETSEPTITNLSNLTTKNMTGTLQLILLYAQLSAQLVKLLLVVRRHLGGGAQVFVVLLNGHLIVHALGLEYLDLL